MGRRGIHLHYKRFGVRSRPCRPPIRSVGPSGREPHTGTRVGGGVVPVIISGAGAYTHHNPIGAVRGETDQSRWGAFVVAVTQSDGRDLKCPNGLVGKVVIVIIDLCKQVPLGVGPQPDGNPVQGVVALIRGKFLGLVIGVGDGPLTQPALIQNLHIQPCTILEFQDV